MPTELLSGLNPEQLVAVTTPASALVLAGAGSGKTRVLTTRIAWLIQQQGIPPTGLMAVTFTNKAAKEMLTRLTALLPINTRGMWVGTFHGLCNRLLRTHHREAGLTPLFTILDSGDQLAAVKRTLRALNADTDKFDPRQVQSFINQNKEMGLRADKVEAWDPYSRHLVEYYAAYDAQCQREGAADFAELLLRSHELLSRNALLREHYQERFRHILVDEFQDTSRLQYEWLKLLKGPTAALFAVGDDDQSIYAFRGAHVGNMSQLMKDFEITAPIKLTRNYRSVSTILDAANALISRNEGRLGKDLWTDAGRGDEIRHFLAESDGDEARFIAQEIDAAHAEGEKYIDIAVLYRANALSRGIEHALFSAAIPYRVYGGQRYFERAEIKHALAYLRMTANPEDDNAFLRVVNFPARGIGNRSLEQLAEQASDGSLWAAACAEPLSKKFSPFVTLIEALRNEIAELTLKEQVEHVVARSGLLTYYKNEKDGEDRVENLEELATAAAAYAQESEDQSMEAFLGHAALEAGEHEAGQGQDAVQLMTVHAAKGLEFRTVFITGLEEGLFPNERAISESDGLEEERRLMYVAITRARKQLYLSHAQSRMLHGQLRYGLPSRFLDEIPPQLVRSLSNPQHRCAAVTRAPAANFVTRKIIPAAPPPPKRLADVPFKIGSRVKHVRYGEGVVASYQGQAPDMEIKINFPKHGEKAFLLEYAKLEAV